jgi:hypothetical protein
MIKIKGEMKMKNHGKFLKILIFLLLPLHVAMAGVIAKVNYNTVELGDMVTYSLDISGSDVVRPKIMRLCDSDVISTSSQTSMQVINGDFKKSYILSYKFIPQKSCTIEPIAVEINGKKEFTNPVSLKVKPASAAKAKEFELLLKTDKKSVYVGESFDVELIFKQDPTARAVDSKFIPPELKGFWVKGESKPMRYQDGNYEVTKLTYTIAAQRVGNLKISKAQMRIATRVNNMDSWGSFNPSIRWKTYFSNELNIDVKALPSGVELVGNFSIMATVDKTSVGSNEAVNLNIKVLGDGNLEDIDSFKPHIDGVSVFDEKIEIKGKELSQKIAFVSDSDFTIPPFTLKFFDTKTQKIKTIKTNPIEIKVKNSKPKSELNIKRDSGEASDELVVKTAIADSNSKSFDMITLVIVLIIGVLIGFVLSKLKLQASKSKKESKISLKNPKQLLVKLLPYKDDAEVKKILDSIEDSLYSSKKLDIDKKALKEILKKYNLD